MRHNKKTRQIRLRPQDKEVHLLLLRHHLRLYPTRYHHPLLRPLNQTTMPTIQSPLLKTWIQLRYPRLIHLRLNTNPAVTGVKAESSDPTFIP